MMAQRDTPPLVEHGAEQATAMYCHRCGPPRALAIVSPGRLWWRVRGQTILVTGGRVTLWCPGCSARCDVDLASPA